MAVYPVQGDEVDVLVSRFIKLNKREPNDLDMSLICKLAMFKRLEYKLDQVLEKLECDQS